MLFTMLLSLSLSLSEVMTFLSLSECLQEKEDLTTTLMS